MGILEKFKKWCTKPTYWELEQKIEHLKIMLEEDNRFLHHDNTSRHLTERYLMALGEDWAYSPLDGIVALREKLGLTPNYKRDA